AAAKRTIAAGTPGAEVFIASADVSVERDVLAALAAAERTHGPVDVLIASAGIAHPGYFEELAVETFERTMQVNYFGTLYPLKAVIPGMRQRRRGAVVLISSGA